MGNASGCVSSFPMVGVETQQNLNADIQGILGLGFQQINKTDAQHSFIIQMYKQNQIAKPLYSVSLGPRVGNSSSDSYMIIGDVDESHYVGDLVEIPVIPNEQNWWMVPCQSI